MKCKLSPMPALRALPVMLLLAAATLCAAELVPIPPASWKITHLPSAVPTTVRVSGFSIGRTELTQGEFRRVMGYNPSLRQGEDLPVENVSWWEAIRCCNLLSAAEALEPCYDLATGACDLARNGYRLPTEAEWELADSTLERYRAETILSLGNLGGSNTKSVPQLQADMERQGPRPAGSYPANFFGLHDMLGNVWEWCNDYNNPLGVDDPTPVADPAGAAWSPSRVARGGSFMSLTGNWARGYRSSLEPERKNAYLGFRVCRSTAPRGTGRDWSDPRWFAPYQAVPDSVRGSLGFLPSPLAAPEGGRIATTAQWEARRAQLLEKWRGILGKMSCEAPVPQVRFEREFRENGYTGKLGYLQVEPDYWEKIYLMLPDRPLRHPTPVVILPYYDVDTPAGQNLGGRNFMPLSVRSFAYLMVQQGYIACAVRWWGESYATGYGESVAELRHRHPQVSGLGKWVWDSQRLVDWLCTLPEVDRAKIGIIGHSLGGKMSLYAAAFEPRITVAVGSDLGIGLDFSNYEDYWYFDQTIQRRAPGTDQHELLALIAPRPWLLIAGDDADSDRSWYFINAARQVYELYGAGERIGLFNHRTGHTPTPRAVELSVDWLSRFLGAP